MAQRIATVSMVDPGSDRHGWKLSAPDWNATYPNRKAAVQAARERLAVTGGLIRLIGSNGAVREAHVQGRNVGPPIPDRAPRSAQNVILVKDIPRTNRPSLNQLIAQNPGDGPSVNFGGARLRQVGPLRRSIVKVEADEAPYHVFVYLLGYDWSLQPRHRVSGAQINVSDPLATVQARVSAGGRAGQQLALRYPRLTALLGGHTDTILITDLQLEMAHSATGLSVLQVARTTPIGDLLRLSDIAWAARVAAAGSELVRECARFLADADRIDSEAARALSKLAEPPETTRPEASARRQRGPSPRSVENWQAAKDFLEKMAALVPKMWNTCEELYDLVSE